MNELFKSLGEGIGKAVIPVICASLFGIGSCIKSEADSHKDAHNVLWNEAGDHFQDIIKTNEIQQAEIQQLKQEIKELELWKNKQLQ